MNCHYCGDPIEHDKKRRLELGVWRYLHSACATNWDNEGRRS